MSHRRRRDRSNLWVVAGLLGFLTGSGVPALAETGARGIPHPLPSHPGDVFVVSEEVAVESSARLNCASSGAWSQANIRVRGNFGAAGQPVLVVRLVPE